MPETLPPGKRRRRSRPCCASGHPPGRSLSSPCRKRRRGLGLERVHEVAGEGAGVDLLHGALEPDGPVGPDVHLEGAAGHPHRDKPVVAQTLFFPPPPPRADTRTRPPTPPHPPPPP